MPALITRGGRAVGALVTALCAVVLLAGPAAADPAGRISDVSVTDAGTITLVFAASELGPGESLDPASITASIGDTSVPATAALIGAQSPAARTAVLVIDTSDSMKGARIDAAMAAATAYLEAAPQDLRIGLVTFDRRARLVVPPTTDRAAMQQAIGRLKAAGSAALYDAVVLASDAVGTEGTGSILLLTDGSDQGSRTSFDEASAAATASKATLDAVYLGADTAPVDTLTSLATATGGKVVTTSTEDLVPAFAASARAVDNQLRVTVSPPAELAGSGSALTISARVGTTAITDTAFVPIPGAPQPTTTPAPAAAGGPIPVSSPAFYDRVDKTWLWAGLAAIFVGLAIMLAVGFVRASRRRSTSVRGRMSIYTLGGRSTAKEPEGTSTSLGGTQVARSAVELADRGLRGRDLEQVLEQRLDAAGLPLKPGEWALVHVGIAVGSGLLLLLVSGGRFLPMIIGLALGVLIPWAYLGLKESKRQEAFYAQLPDTLQLLAGSLSAGYSLPQAVDTVVREGNDPIAAEFNRALVEARLGVPIEEALDNIAERMDSQDFHWVVLAIRVQREVGGNLAEVLTTVAATLRERERLRRQVQVLSAEGRLSAVIIALIPILFTIFLIFVRPEYLKPLYTTAIGLLMLGFGVLMLLVGIFWLRRVVRVEV